MQDFDKQKKNELVEVQQDPDRSLQEYRQEGVGPWKMYPADSKSGTGRKTQGPCKSPKVMICPEAWTSRCRIQMELVEPQVRHGVLPGSRNTRQEPYIWICKAWRQQENKSVQLS